MNPSKPLLVFGRCVTCGRELAPNDPDNLEEVIAWGKPRPKGGFHSLRFITKTDRKMCGRCARTRAATGNARQETIG